MNLLLWLAIICIAVSCRQEAAKKEGCTNVHQESNVNPNGNSELALLMRKIHVDFSMIKKKLEEGKTSLKFEEYNTLTTAVPTDAEVPGKVFDGYATSFLQGINSFNKAEESTKRTVFNSCVDNCVACHEQFCTGPIKTINKLRIKN